MKTESALIGKNAAAQGTFSTPRRIAAKIQNRQYDSAALGTPSCTREAVSPLASPLPANAASHSTTAPKAVLSENGAITGFPIGPSRCDGHRPVQGRDTFQAKTCPTGSRCAAARGTGRRSATTLPHSAIALQIFASLLLCASALMPLGSGAATNDLSGLLQKGLFEEEANRNLEAAAQAYQTVSVQFDKDRKLAATAIFRLGEIYRKQGKTNEAASQYDRIIREFADQDTLVTLSRQNLAGLGTGRTNKSVPESKTSTPDFELLQRIKALPRTELRRIMPILSLDPTLVELLAMLNESQAKFAQQFGRGTNAHPAEIARLLSAQTVLAEKIDHHIDELINGMEQRAANSTGAQITSQPSNDPLSRPP